MNNKILCITLALFIVVLSILFSSCSEKREPKREEKTNIISAADFHSNYKQYIGNQVTVSGSVVAPEGDSPVGSLSSGRFLFIDAGSSDLIQCDFLASENAKLTQIKQKDIIVVSGICDENFYTVKIKNSVLQTVNNTSPMSVIEKSTQRSASPQFHEPPYLPKEISETFNGHHPHDEIFYSDPNWPLTLPVNECEWHITISKGKFTRIEQNIASYEQNIVDLNNVFHIRKVKLIEKRETGILFKIDAVSYPDRPVLVKDNDTFYIELRKDSTSGAYILILEKSSDPKSEIPIFVRTKDVILIKG